MPQLPPRVTVDDVIDDPQLQADIAALNYKWDMKMLRLYQRSGALVPKALWRRIIRYRRAHA